ncbi:hypothetical protein FOL80_01320 [Lactobacillus reuteri]|uniref:hypothetical protein n=1 Tax=Limosilactobacillus reuteri TaxID=1598 RepID=UPI00146AE783|nr:hypothetical protein [Limosilactobacillus reuteri]NMV48354.1 hypothetical protein [Limosilactobacillus reuteri]NMV49988.1 hypothetical protein [Limosilactobacillus reuteri]NMV59124.1 hypothetical protein [Limosilactobacillus reuteri]NMV60934.1 hypothetical protein [Limosilactobacillus reuteri]NMV62684.1 hypothetical protein [Limosilactobacillus reuteri]
MTIPKRLFEAMNSLSKNNEWGEATEMPEDVLAPSDWRLQEIMKFRRDLELREARRIKESEWRIKQYFHKHNINNPFAQAYILRKIEAKQSTILEITGLLKPEYYRHIGVLFRNAGRYRQLRITDVEAVLTQEKLYDLLEDTHGKNFG